MILTGDNRSTVRTRQAVHCTATLRRVRGTTVAVEMQYYVLRVCVCNLSYPAGKAHAPCYIVICGQSVSTVFFHVISQTARFSGKTSLKIKCVF
jgi:hypothetical protein